MAWTGLGWILKLYSTGRGYINKADSMKVSLAKDYLRKERIEKPNSTITLSIMVTIPLSVLEKRV